MSSWPFCNDGHGYPAGNAFGYEELPILYVIGGPMLWLLFQHWFRRVDKSVLILSTGKAIFIAEQDNHFIPLPGLALERDSFCNQPWSKFSGFLRCSGLSGADCLYPVGSLYCQKNQMIRDFLLVFQFCPAHFGEQRAVLVSVLVLVPAAGLIEPDPCWGYGFSGQLP